MINLVRRTENTTLVCVKSSFEYGQLIREGRKIADLTNTKLYVVNVQKTCEWGKKFCEELEFLLRLSKNLSGEMLVFFSDDPTAIINDYIERNNVKHIVLGNSSKVTTDFIDQLNLKTKEIETHIYKYQ
jgi:K+-sensing histidine kinase KdpD